MEEIKPEDWTPKERENEVYFVVREGDGEIIPMGATEVWNTFKNASNWQRRDFKLVGHSDCKAYYKKVDALPQILAEKAEKQKEITKDLQRYEKTYERLKFEEVLDDSDEKVKRVKEKIKEVSDELNKVEEDIEHTKKNWVKDALKEELEIAKKNGAKLPSNQDVYVGKDSKHREDEIFQLLKPQLK